MRSRVGLRLFLLVLGAVAIGAGGLVMVLGATTIVGVDDPSPAVDSEMRFFATWYVAAGLYLLTAAKDLDAKTPAIRGVIVAFGLAGVARAISWGMVGRPPALAIALMAIELLLPVVVLPWLARAELDADR